MGNELKLKSERAQPKSTKERRKKNMGSELKLKSERAQPKSKENRKLTKSLCQWSKLTNPKFLI